jgi:hypothetical protein
MTQACRIAPAAPDRHLDYMATTAWSRMEAERAFTLAARARRRAALICRVRSRTRGCGCGGGLPVFDRPTARRTGAASAHGLLEIPLDAIRGTLEPNRAAQFDSDFRPARSIRDRWQNIWLAEHRGAVLPPISVVQIGREYAIRDGHHRVSVARARGASTISAVVHGAA